MKPQYQHNVTTSFALWFDHYLLEKGEAYSNQTGTFTYYADPRISTTYKAFGTPYKQFVYDSTITGASIPSGVHVSGVFKGRNDGVIIGLGNTFLHTIKLLQQSLLQMTQLIIRHSHLAVRMRVVHL
jgi:hypothetical protein